MHRFNLMTAAIFSTLAGAGGAARFISQRIKSKEVICPYRFTLLLASNIFISGFSGLMMALLAATITNDHTIQLVAAGTGGYAGIEVMNILSSILKARLKKYQ